MSEGNDGGKSGDWFPNIKQLMLILFTGTLIATQVPFHETRPVKPETSIKNHGSVDARLWQDPFEAVEKYRKEHGENNDPSVKDMQGTIQLKVDGNGGSPLHVVAVMLPDDPYFEDSETRRRIRYAVLSGFSATLRYMPENPTHIQYFAPKDNTRVVYEWMVYKATDLDYAPKSDEKHYKQAPVLVLWLNRSDFGVTPHGKLTALIAALNIASDKLKHVASNFKNKDKQCDYLRNGDQDIDAAINTPAKLQSMLNCSGLQLNEFQQVYVEPKYQVQSVSVLGPFGSDGLQDLVAEIGNWDDHVVEGYHYFSPNATIQESNLYKANYSEVYPKSLQSHFFARLLFEFESGKDISAFPSSYISLESAVPTYQFASIELPKESLNAEPHLFAEDNYRKFLRCADVTALADVCSHTIKNYNYTSLQQYFALHGLSFLRVTATDENLAKAVKKELALRGIQASPKNRILLVGESDSLYSWHLNTTFSYVLQKDSPFCDKTLMGIEQFWNVLSDIDQQCIYRINYLRGLDGEKQNQEGNRDKSTTETKNTQESKSAQNQNIEQASGDSQFDYVRRLAIDIDELDKQIRQNSDDHFKEAHAIKAIGILGTDVYDKLLIVEALHSKFPDAIFFTNGMDARFLEPKHNEWARNMIVASSFGLKLDRQLQRNIPPFRDNIQTAYFLATEMALTQKLKTPTASDNSYMQVMLSKSQTNVDKLIMPDSQPHAQVFELGRTDAINLNASDCDRSKSELATFQPCQYRRNWTAIDLVVVILGASLLLAAVPAARQFLNQRAGLYFTLFVVFVCTLVLALAYQVPKWTWFDRVSWEYKTVLTMLLAFAFIFFIFKSLKQDRKNYAALLSEDSGEDAENGAQHSPGYFNLALSLLVLAIEIFIIYSFVKPHGLLASVEPYEFVQGVSMWPPQALRLVALVLSGYFIIQVARFPIAFTKELNKNHFHTELTSNHLVKNWLKWSQSNLSWLSLCCVGLLLAAEFCLLLFLGIPNIPYRGENLFLLNGLLMQGLLVPASLFLLVLVVDAVRVTADLAENCFPYDLEKSSVNWPEVVLKKYAARYNMANASDMQEWVTMRFIVELTKKIYELIGYPLIVVLLIVVAYSSYFDNWQIPLALKLTIVSYLAVLLYWDYRLKKAADTARARALKSLRARIIRHQRSEKSKERVVQLNQLSNIIENYDGMVYKPFTQRSIFQKSLLIVFALLANSFDYTTITSKLF